MSETVRTTKSGETITTQETARYRYFVTLRPNTLGRGDIGPAIAEVITYSHTSDKRPEIRPTYRVFIDGQSAYGGPEFHLGDDPASALKSFAGTPVLIWRTGYATGDPELLALLAEEEELEAIYRRNAETEFDQMTNDAQSEFTRVSLFPTEWRDIRDALVFAKDRAPKSTRAKYEAALDAFIAGTSDDKRS